MTEPAGKPEVEVERLAKTYPGGTEAVRGISFTVRAGEVFGLLGPVHTMPGTNATSRPASPGLASRAYEIMTAVSMTIGRGPLARAAADAARLTPADRVLDIGCGPGTAVRLAARRAEAATGIDPSPVMLQLARQISMIRRSHHVSWAEGKAEKLPVPDGQATVAWAISSAHHWDDRSAGLSEARRALAPGGRLVLAERLAREHAHGHAAHGLTSGQAEDLARQLTAAGFLRVQVQARKARRRRLVIVRGETSTATSAGDPRP